MVAASDSEKSPKAEKKALLKAEAEKLGLSYEELKQQKKDAKAAKKAAKESKSKRKREAEKLSEEAEEVIGGNGHKDEVKRMRSWSKDFDAKGHHGPDGTGAGAATIAAAVGGVSASEDEPETKRRRTRSMDIKEELVNAASKKPGQTLDQWRNEHSITLKSHTPNVRVQDLPEPFYGFDDAPYAKSIMKVIDGMGFAAPTAVQSQAWPIAINGHDMISIAKTGSGKTLGFFLPLLHRLLGDGNESFNHSGNDARRGRAKPSILILAPTRELATQILDEAKKFAYPVHCRTVCCYGGANKFPQIQAFERGVEVVVATPGRLNDLLEMRKADLSGIKFLVLDEADRMLDMGFEPQIRSIVAKVPDQRQTLLFSATWPKEIQRLAHDFLTDPIQVNVGEVDALVANKDIKQEILMCSEGDKFEMLKEILNKLTKEGPEAMEKMAANARDLGGKKHPKVIVFVAKKVSCHELSNRLWDDGFAVDSLHGDRAQWERTKIMGAFKEGTLRMLIATDVAARGLDVKDVGAVVNYDMPVGGNAVEDYVHRIGRTGRAGAKGRAYTLFTPKDSRCATQLVEVLTKA
eukprot:CAMPEP_0113549756 /NCGR_PEP_ID=MMETSP0015_2-20120614/13611_1 /TAXON_ID=2838 /ORGANISM="Odontella" /LENGTH=577 /DNA_ID=CAMNT_0000450503 /DNA_START=118 /DNA_END=1847 /DNA_ORIENTATION=+ /assembly_acc=CAM_ASM_000160